MRRWSGGKLGSFCHSHLFVEISMGWGAAFRHDRSWLEPASKMLTISRLPVGVCPKDTDRAAVAAGDDKDAGMDCHPAADGDQNPPGPSTLLETT